MWWRKRSRPGQPEGSTGLRDAQRAVIESRRCLDSTTRRTTEVHAVAGKLRHLREINHFTERITMLLIDTPEEHHHGGR